MGRRPVIECRSPAVRVVRRVVLKRMSVERAVAGRRANSSTPALLSSYSADVFDKQFLCELVEVALHLIMIPFPHAPDLGESRLPDA